MSADEVAADLARWPLVGVLLRGLFDAGAWMSRVTRAMRRWLRRGAAVVLVALAAVTASACAVGVPGRASKQADAPPQGASVEVQQRMERIRALFQERCTAAAEGATGRAEWCLHVAGLGISGEEIDAFTDYEDSEAGRAAAAPLCAELIGVVERNPGLRLRRVKVLVPNQEPLLTGEAGSGCQPGRRAS